ncbi:hypothetical protein K2173_012768 [Erythroxylum novogranatense]|uniref:Uncharacterized protein n=1 Tax=Erythroxylum novogranatense TaxID=1862640 RepID=A0AAV8U9W2_9ROSI|nr:hypothetical protein K2173_012768 [Erythroxylum novogranatense]
MKRDIFQVPQDPSARSPRDFHGDRSSKCGPVTHQNQACEPKMSEYAFFKKLQEDADSRFRSHSQDREKHQSKKLKTSCNSGGAQYRQLDVFSRKRKNLQKWVANTSFPDELCSKGCDIISALLSRLFPVTIMEKTGKGQIDGKTKVHTFPCSNNYSNESHQMPIRNMMEIEDKLPFDNDLCFCWLDIPSEPDISSSSPEIYHEAYKDSRMRALQLLRESKTHGFYAEDNSTFGFQIPEYEPDTCNDLKGTNRFHYFNKSFSGDELHLPLVDWEFNNIVDERKPSPTCRTTEFSMLPYQKQKQNSIIGEFRSPNNPLSSEEPHPLLLGWDFKNMMDDRNLSLSCENTELSMCPNSWGLHADDQQLENHSRFSVNGLCKPSLLCHRSPNLPSLCWHPSPSHDSHDLEEGILEIKEKVDTVLDDCSLPLHGDHNLVEYCHPYSTCDSRSIILSPQNHLWFMSKILDDEQCHTDRKVLFSSGINFNSVLKHSPVSNSLRDYYIANNHALVYPYTIDTSSTFPAEDKYENYPCGLGHGAVYHCSHEDMTKEHDWQLFASSLCIEKALAFSLDESYKEGSEREFSDNGEVKYF